MNSKLLYGLLSILGLGAIGTVVYNNSLEDEQVLEDKVEDIKVKNQKAGGNIEEDTQLEDTQLEDDDNYNTPDIDLSEIFQVQFEDLNHLISKKEKKSKLLKKSSSLYSVLTVYRNKLLSVYGEDVSDQRMDFHIELVKNSEEWSEEKVLNRAKELEGRCIDLADTDAWNIGRHSVTIKTGRVMGYGNTHITLAYFKNGVPEDVEDVLFEIDDNTTEDDEDENEIDNITEEDEDEDEDDDILTL